MAIPYNDHLEAAGEWWGMDRAPQPLSSPVSPGPTSYVGMEGARKQVGELLPARACGAERCGLRVVGVFSTALG